MTRIWEFSDSKAIPSDLVREQDFILRIRRLQRLGTPHLVVNLALEHIGALTKSRRALEAVEQGLKEFAKVTNGTYVDMSNGDVFMIWEETADAGLLASRLVKVLLPEGPGNEDSSAFLTTYHMPADYTALRERANDYVELVRNATTSPASATPSDVLRSEAARGPLTAWSVDQIGRLIHEIDISAYARFQPIYRLESGNRWVPIRQEYFVSFEDLRRERFPKLDIIAPEHLFLALCEMIDQQLLASLNKAPDVVLGKPVNLNLSVAAIMGAPFAHFAMNVPHDKRSLITLEIHRGELLQDFARTLGAIETLRREKFKVALDAITPDMLPYLDLNAFSVDCIKISVAKDRIRMLDDPAIAKALSRIDPTRIILFRCDNEATFAAGKKFGIVHFQGWLIDELVKGKRA